jgi:hypothetical protein
LAWQLSLWLFYGRKRATVKHSSSRNFPLRFAEGY